MYKKLKINILLFFTATFFLSCSKEKITLQWQEIPTHLTDNLRGVYFSDAQHGAIIGGKTWSRGISLNTSDGGNTWRMDSLQGWSLYGLGSNTEGDALTIGISGEVFCKQIVDTTFHTTYQSYGSWFRDIAARKKLDGLVCVGGQSWQAGIIVRVDGLGKVKIDSFKQELESVCYSDDSTIHAVGYGLVVRSINGGKTWNINTLKDDFYQSVCFPSSKIGYTVGLGGIIAKTEDSGATWKKLRNGDALTVSSQPFRAVFFTDILRGYIVGDQGLMWLTKDGGETWQTVKDLPKVDFYDIFVSKTEGWIVGSGGKIIKFKVE